MIKLSYEFFYTLFLPIIENILTVYNNKYKIKEETKYILKIKIRKIYIYVH